LDKPCHNESTIWSMNKALEFIQAHLQEPLTLEDISQVALLSKFHFHRIFKMVTSESLIQFIQRLRIEKAANMIYTESYANLTDIAMQCGFSSSGYFSRIFKEHYGISASAFRKLPLHDKQQFIQTHVKGLASLKSFPQLEEKLDVRIERISSMHLAYIRKYYFDLQEEPGIIHRLFEFITTWGQQKGLMGADTRVLGIIHDNPYLTPFSKYQYDACITVKSPIPEEGIVGTKTLSEGTYAVLKLRGISKEILERSIYTFLTSWLISSGYSMDNRPILEFYYGPPAEGNFNMDFCAPVHNKHQK